MLWYIAIGSWCFIFGLVVSLFTPYHRELRRRLRSIYAVSEEAFRGEVDVDNAILFITLESNLNTVVSSDDALPKVSVVPCPAGCNECEQKNCGVRED